jgi:hypothetical protein
MVPEPPHLVGRSMCLRCYSRDVQFRYFNNKKEDQPRYWCYRCNKFYTHGGKVRDSKPVDRNRAVSPVEPLVVEGGEHEVGQENIEEMDANNKEEVVYVGEGSGQHPGIRADADDSEEAHAKLSLPTKRTKATTLRAWVKKPKVQQG